MSDESVFVELYNKFRDALASDSGSMYFDENELIDIFDYAGDIEDDYVRLEVLLLAARIHPDSEELLQRRAIFLSSVSLPALQDFMKSVPPGDNSTMWRILRARSFANFRVNESLFLEFVSTLELNNDEEIIQFVALCKVSDCLDLLIANIEKVKDRCHDSEVLFYEVARQCDTPQQMDLALPILEDLTMTDPFNIDYWTLMAEFQIALGQYNQALQSVNFAKAIDPENYLALSYEASALMALNRFGEAAEALRKAEKNGQDSYLTRTQLVEALRQEGRIEEAASLARELFNENPIDSDMMMQSLLLKPETAEEVLSMHYRSGGSIEEDLMLRRVSVLSNMGAIASAVTYLRWYRKAYDLSVSAKCIMLELLYVSGNYKEALDCIQETMDDIVLQPSEIATAVVIASVLMRNRLFDKALEFCNEWINEMQALQSYNLTINVLSIGVKIKLRAIRELLMNNSEPSDAEIESVVL